MNGLDLKTCKGPSNTDLLDFSGQRPRGVQKADFLGLCQHSGLAKLKLMWDHVRSSRWILVGGPGASVVLSVFVCLGWLCFVNLFLPSPVLNVTQSSFFHLLLSVLFAFCRQDKHLNPLDLPVTVSSVAVWKGPRLPSRWGGQSWARISYLIPGNGQGTPRPRQRVCAVHLIC